MPKSESLGAAVMRLQGNMEERYGCETGVALAQWVRMEVEVRCEASASESCRRAGGQGVKVAVAPCGGAASLIPYAADRDWNRETLHAMRAAGAVRLQQTVGNAAATTLVLQRQPKSQPNPVEQAGRALRDFEAWADEEKKRQNVTDTAAVVGLDPKQAASVQAAATKIAGYIPTMRAAAAEADPSIASLSTAVTLAKKANSLMQSRDEIDRLEAGPARNQSREAVMQAIAQVSKIDSGIDVKGLIKNLKAIEAALKQADRSPT